MAYWTYSFQDANDDSVIVSIGGMSVAKQLTPSDAPFTTSADTSDDPFKPLRGGSGYIRVLGKIADFAPLFEDTAINHKVTVSSEGGRHWRGCLKAEAYSMGEQNSLQSIEIPVIDTVSMLSCIRMPADWSWAPTRLGDILYNIIDELDAGITDLIFPARTLPATILNHYIRPERWITDSKEADSSGNHLQYETLDVLMKDICIAYGWCLRQHDTSWFFESMSDNGSTYYRVPVAQLLQSQPTTTTLTVSNVTSSSLNSASSNNSISIHQGAKCVTIKNNPGTVVKDLFSIDLSDVACRQINSGILSASPHAGIFAYDFGKEADMLTRDQAVSYAPLWNKFNQYYLGNIAETDVEAPGIALESIDYTNDNTESTITKGLSLSPCDNGTTLIATIAPRWKVNTIDDTCYINCQGTLKVLYHWADGFVAPNSSITLAVAISVGNKYLAQGQQWVNNETYNFFVFEAHTGKLTSFINQPAYRVKYPLKEYAHGAIYKFPGAMHGDLTVKIKCPVQSASNPVVGYIIEDFSIELFHAFTLNGKDRDGKDNKFTQYIGDNEQDYTLSGSLTTRQGDQRGAGVILDAPMTDNEGNVEYPAVSTCDTSGLTPEASYGQRIVSQISTPYRIIKATVTDEILPWQSVSISSHVFKVAGESRDWHTKKNTLQLIEIKQQ